MSYPLAPGQPGPVVAGQARKRGLGAGAVIGIVAGILVLALVVCGGVVGAVILLRSPIANYVVVYRAIFPSGQQYHVEYIEYKTLTRRSIISSTSPWTHTETVPRHTTLPPDMDVVTADLRTDPVTCSISVDGVVASTMTNTGSASCDVSLS
jgi:hypothetical protein